MSIGFDPVVSSFLFSASLIPHAARPHMELEMPSRSSADVPFVTVIVALYRAKREHIEMTLESLMRQTHPKHRFEVLLVVEADDVGIPSSARAGSQKLHDAG